MTAGEVADWLIARIAEVLSVPAGSMSADMPFMQLGLSSMQAVELSGDLEQWTGLTIPPTLAYDYPTIEAAAAYVAAAAAGDGEDPAAGAPAVAQAGPEPIAIVGMGCRMPGGGGLAGFRRLLREGVDAIREIPADRWDGEALYDPDPDTAGRMNTRWGGFLDDIAGFDAEFFGIPPKEAARMDPQQRIVMEVAWEALEDAGIPAGRLAGSLTGVFMGVSTFDHSAGLLVAGGEPEPYDGLGAALSIVANRLSYSLDLRGPSMVVDTACSSSLVAIHAGCQALRGGEAELAIAGGINVITSPRIALSFSKGRLMAADGRCKTFDHRADGYVRSEGAGVVVLKPLSRAIADRDRIYAVIRGGAINQDGRTNGLAAPNRLAQEAVLRSAYAAAGVAPAEVDYVEAHGTGTAVGDPIEVGALATVLGSARAAEHPLRVGSVKSNVGHLEAAAGVAGLMKTALALHQGELAPSIHFEKPNPMLGLDRLPVRVQDRREAWPVHPDRPGLAGVSSFGFGGTNAHIVLSGPPAPAPAVRPGLAEDTARLSPAHLIPISARSATALARRAAGWAELAQRHTGDQEWLARAAAAATLRADHHRHRAAVVAATTEELAAGMAALAAGETAPGVCGPRQVGRRPPRPVLVFPGQGPQWEGMGRQLAATVPAFRDAIRRCDAEISRWLGRSLWSDEHGLVAEGTAQVQPALFAIEVALAETWRAWGVPAAAVVGHSMGEIAAAHIAGALSLADAARIACERSRLLAELTGAGGLALVELDVNEATALVKDRPELAVAALNGPRATVLSGDSGALDEVVADLDRRGVFARRIAVEFAAHSPQVEPVQPRLRAAVEGIRPGALTTTLYSTVTGERIAGTALGPAYWEQNVRATVRFAPAMERLLAEGHHAFVEVAPHPVLMRSVDELTAAAGVEATVVASVRRDEDELRGMLRALGELHTAGVPVDWSALHPGGADHLDLPPHGWERRHFPLIGAGVVAAASPGRGHSGAGRPGDGQLLGERLPLGVEPDLRVWPLRVDLAQAPELADHVVDEVPLVAGAYWLTAAAQAAAAGSEGGEVVIEEVAFPQPCPLVEGQRLDLQIAVRPPRDGRAAMVVTSLRAGQPVSHATGVVAGAGAAPAAAPLAELRERLTAAVPVEELYERLGQAGLGYGPRFRGLTELRVAPAGLSAAGTAGAPAGQEALGRVELPDGLAAPAVPLHPALLDACFHTVAAAAGGGNGELPLPVGVDRVWTLTGPAGSAGLPPMRSGWCRAVVREARGREIAADLAVYDDEGRLRWAATRLRVSLVGRRRPVEAGRLYQPRWQPVAMTAGPAGGGWLICGDPHGLGSALAERLAGAGEPCLVVPEAGSYDELLARAQQRAGRLRGVIDLRGAGPDPAAIDLAALHRPAAGTLRLAQAVAGWAWETATPRLWLVTTGTQPVPDQPTGEPGLIGAPLWGLGRVIANEHPQLGCTIVDLASPVRQSGVDALYAALHAADPPNQLALRPGAQGTGWFEPRLAPLAGWAGGDRSPAIRDDRTYLVTGGLGALGRHVTQWLVDRGARHLLLLGRGEPSASTEALIERLRGSGASVRLGRIDVSDPGAVRGALAGLGEHHPALAGVFHLAGVLENTLAADLTDDVVRRALAGKAAGAWHLHALTKDQPVELFVLFSSMAGLLGSPGQGAYAAGNSFLDALAAHRVSQGLPGVSIAWGAWAGSGLAVEVGGVGRLAARGLPPLTAEVALVLLDEALQTGASQVAAMAFRPEESGWQAAVPGTRRMLEGLLPSGPAAPAVARGSVRAAVLALPARTEQVRALREFLRDQVAAILGTAGGRVDGTVPFQELGFDSLMAVELRNRLETALDVRLSAALVFAHPTVDELAEGLLGRMAPAGAAAPAVPPAVPVEPAPPAAADDLSTLDEDELAALLARELDPMEER